MPVKLSAVLVAHNEAAQIADCLETVRFADEIVVVLDRCTDDSGVIARRFTEHVIEGAWEIEGPRRMAGLAAASGDWRFEIDADERVTPELAAEIRRAIDGAPFGYFKVPVANHIGGRWVRHGWGAYNGVSATPRLSARGAKRWGDQLVHPKLALSGAAMWLEQPLIHYVDRDFADMLERMNRNTSARARDLVASGDIGSLGANLRRVLTRFFKSYVQRKGYREGATGLMLGLFAALYPLISYLKARELLSRAAAPRPPASPHP
ncbi:MAG: glycosyltransferase family 2 protein [Proteobacteria bacterium]|nr:glycosyltransferase family 2 protein [Pseudomonadota bacterium]